MTTARHDRVQPGPCHRCGEPTMSSLKYYGRRWSRTRVEHRVHTATGLTICADQHRHATDPQPNTQPGQLALT